MCKGTENYPLQYRNIRPKNTANGETFVDGMVKVVKNVDTSLTVSKAIEKPEKECITYRIRQINWDKFI